MTLLWSDSGDSYAATSDLTKGWAIAASPWAWVSNAGRGGGGAFQAIGGAGGSLLQTFSGLANTNLFGVCFWMQCSAAPAAVSTLFSFLTNIGGNPGALRISTTGTLNLYNDMNTLRGVGSVNVCDGNWHWVELYCTTANSSLNKLYVDTIAEFNGIFGASSTSNLDHWSFSSIASRTLTISWPFVFDSNASVPSTSGIPLGPCEMQTTRPNADSVVQFTPNSGVTNYTQVNEVNADGDTSYVQDGTSGDQDLYTFNSLSGTPITIQAVNLKTYAYNPSPGTINMQGICKSNATQTNGTSVIVPSAYQYKQQPFATDPNTSASWTTSGLNAAKFGIKVV